MFRRKKREEEKSSGDEFSEDQRDEEEFFGDDFDVFEADFTKIDEMMRRMMNSVFRNFEITFNSTSGAQPGRQGGPIVYGFSVRTGPDGKPIVNEFGNVKFGTKASAERKGTGKPVVENAIEPMFDIVENGKNIIVVVDLPGVEKDDIEMHAGDSSLEINVARGKRKYYKMISLPAQVKTDSINATYKNGVLEVKLEKKEGKEGMKKVVVNGE